MNAYLAQRTHTHLYSIVNPAVGYKDDTDLQLRTLAHKEEALARKARDERRNGDAATHADLAIRYHLEAEARYRPTAQPPRQLAGTRWETVLIVSIFFVFAMDFLSLVTAAIVAAAPVIFSALQEMVRQVGAL